MLCKGILNRRQKGLFPTDSFFFGNQNFEFFSFDFLRKDTAAWKKVIVGGRKEVLEKL